jgi:hypothetical protein
MALTGEVDIIDYHVTFGLHVSKDWGQGEVTTPGCQVSRLAQLSNLPGIRDRKSFSCGTPTRARESVLSTGDESEVIAMAAENYSLAAAPAGTDIILFIIDSLIRAYGSCTVCRVVDCG